MEIRRQRQRPGHRQFLQARRDLEGFFFEREVIVSRLDLAQQRLIRTARANDLHLDVRRRRAQQTGGRNGTDEVAPVHGRDSLTCEYHTPSLSIAPGLRYSHLPWCTVPSPLLRTGIAILVLQISALAAAPGSEYSHRVWRIEDGLPQNRIRALCQTPDGYLWVGTAEGLARFDGVRFTIFDHSNATALHDDGILALRVARDGALWIGTEGGGLVRYQGWCVSPVRPQ